MVLTDLLGGSPYNATARSFYELGSEVKAECITGVNLPMILRAAGHSTTKIEILAEEAKQAGLQGIVSASDMLRKKKG